MLYDYLGQYNDYTKFFCARSAEREPPTSHRIPKCKRGRECSGQLDRPSGEVRGALSALGTLLRILSVLGLEGDLEALARDDRAGRLLQDQALPARRRRGARAKTPEQKERAP